MMGWKKTIARYLPDGVYLRIQFFRILKRTLRLQCPSSFCEKIQWLKIHDHNPKYPIMVDKYAMKEYVASVIGGEYVLPVLGVWDQYDDIDFDKLPDEFVLKCTHDSGSVEIITDKNTIDHQKLKYKYSNALSTNFYFASREWPYKEVTPRILAESYIREKLQANEGEGLTDYKVHCFNGKPEFIQVIGDRDLATHKGKQANYDFDWKLLDWVFEDYPAFGYELNKPDCLNELYDLSVKLCEGIPYVRLDFYILDSDDIRLGEITFYPGGGFYPYVGSFNKEKDLELGGRIDLDGIG